MSDAPTSDGTVGGVAGVGVDVDMDVVDVAVGVVVDVAAEVDSCPAYTSVNEYAAPFSLVIDVVFVVEVAK